jgi:hypothetical protein
VRYALSPVFLSLSFNLLIISCVAAVDDLFGGTIPTGNGLDDEDAASADVVSLDGARSNSFESSFFVVISLTSCIDVSFDSLIFQRITEYRFICGQLNVC